MKYEDLRTANKFQLLEELIVRFNSAKGKNGTALPAARLNQHGLKCAWCKTQIKTGNGMVMIMPHKEDCPFPVLEALLERRFPKNFGKFTADGDKLYIDETYGACCWCDRYAEDGHENECPWVVIANFLEVPE